MDTVTTLEQALSVIGPGGEYLQHKLKTLPDPQTEQFLLGAARCALAYSSSPWHTSKAARDPDYWLVFYASQPFSFSARIRSTSSAN